MCTYTLPHMKKLENELFLFKGLLNLSDHQDLIQYLKVPFISLVTEETEFKIL